MKQCYFDNCFNYYYIIGNWSNKLIGNWFVCIIGCWQNMFMFNLWLIVVAIQFWVCWLLYQLAIV
jgi:hypothetical protein